MESRVGRLTTSATPDSAHEAHHDHDQAIEGPAITAEGLRDHAAMHAAPDVPDVHINGVTKRFGDVVAVDNMDLVVARGAFYSFLGPSGCGKTTTSRMIAGFEQPTSARSTSPRARRGRAALPAPREHRVPALRALFPHMTVAQNVGYGLRQKGIGKHDEQHRVGEALDLVGSGAWQPAGRGAVRADSSSGVALKRAR